MLPSYTNVNTSNLPFVVVNVGAVPPGHLTATPPYVQVIVYTDPFGIVITVKLLILPAVKLLIVQLVTLAFKVNLTTVSLFKSTVTTPADGDTDEKVSLIPSN